MKSVPHSCVADIGALPMPMLIRLITRFSVQFIPVLIVWMIWNCVPVSAWAQVDTLHVDTVQRRTVFVGIKVGSRTIPEQEWDDIVIAQSDSITFNFGCQTSVDQSRRENILFEIVLQNEKGVKRSDNARSPSTLWKGLEQMTYTFSVQAFAPGSWKATPEVLVFRVDNTEAARREKERLDAVRREDSTTVSKQSVQSASSLVEWGVYLLLALVVAGAAVAIVLQSVRQRRKTGVMNQAAALSGTVTDATHIQHTVDKGDTMANQDTLSYEQLQRENSVLRAEIAALRGQIDALQVRTDELQKTNRDLARQKERLLDHKKQLEELQAQKDELFSMVVHDIKNPAGLIRGLVELLRSYDLTAQEQQEIMEDLMATSSRILSLAQEVSRIVTLESGVMKLDFVGYPVGRIIEDVCRRNQAAAVKKNIEVQRDTSALLPDIEVDVHKMEEVLDNLVSNAIKFSDNGSSIKVKSAKVGGKIVVEVIDNGPGLTEEDIKRAFGRGARLSAKPTGGESSSGLGLWIVKKIVEAHHGRVWVKSSVLKGSTFAFELPLAQPAVEPKDSDE